MFPPLLGGSIPVSFRKVSTVYLTSSKDASDSCSSATFARMDGNCSSVNWDITLSLLSGPPPGPSGPLWLGGVMPFSSRKLSTTPLISSKDAPDSYSSETFARIDVRCSSVRLSPNWLITFLWLGRPPGPFGAGFCLSDAPTGWIDRSIFFLFQIVEMLITWIRDNLKIKPLYAYQCSPKVP